MNEKMNETCEHSLVHDTIIYLIFPVTKLKNMYQSSVKTVVLTYFVPRFYLLPSSILQKLLKNAGNPWYKWEYSHKLFQLFDINYFIQNKLFTHSWSGFIPGDSCVEQLLSIMHKIYTSFDCKPLTDMTRHSLIFIKHLIKFGMKIWFLHYKLMMYMIIFKNYYKTT